MLGQEIMLLRTECYPAVITHVEQSDVTKFVNFLPFSGA